MVNQRVLEFDTFISLAQLKVHRETGVTLSMKKMAMSFPAAGYYSYPRKDIHQSTTQEGLQDFIAAMCARLPLVHLGIIAAHPAMTESGPIGGLYTILQPRNLNEIFWSLLLLLDSKEASFNLFKN